MNAALQEYSGAWGSGPARGCITVIRRLLSILATLMLAGLVGGLLAGILSRYIDGITIIGGGVAAQWFFAALIAIAIPLSRLPGGLTPVSLYRPEERGAAAIIPSEAIIVFTLLTLFDGSRLLLAAIGGTDPALGLPVWVRFVLLAPSILLALPLGLLGDIAEGRRIAARIAGIIVGLVCWSVSDTLGGLLSGSAPPVLVLALFFILGLITGTPVAIAMLFACIMAETAGAPMPPAAIAQTMINGASKHLLLAAPLFITAGALMNSGRLTERLIGFATALVGHFRGGLGQVAVAASTLFAGISGSSYAEATIGAKLLVPEMRKRGYPPADAAAITAAASVLPNIIPPSVALLILAGVANLSVGALWLAGILPGLLLALCLMIVIAVMARRRNYPYGESQLEGSAILGHAAAASPVLALAVIIVLGIRFGLVTPTEAGILAIIYAAFLGLMVYRAYDLRQFLRTLRDAAEDSARVGLLIGAASPFAFILVTEQAPQQLGTWLLGQTSSILMILIAANLLLLLFGMVLDIGAAILILTPILMPVAIAAGIDPIHFGVVIVINLMIGGLTPPVGMLVYISAGLTGISAASIFRAALPFVAALLCGLGAILLIPAIALAPGWIFGS